MNTYVIMTDINADLPEEYIREHGLEVLSLSYMIDGETYDRNHPLEVGEFYKRMRNGSMPTTSQVNPDQAKKAFTACLKQGKDVLYIAFSSALSGTYNSGRIAAEEIKEEGLFPDRKLVVLDSLSASLGQGLLVHKAVQLKEAGKSLEETVSWVEENKLNLCHIFTVDDLFHLHRGGRVSKATAVLGTMINIKPILHVDEEGRLTPIGKVRGRRKSLSALADRMGEQIKGFENPEVFISHGDCLEDAEYVEKLVRERFGVENFVINHVGPTIGAHSGPGTMALFFMGNQR
ncbi:MAG: DegV family protein [Lachnospiraceae bacterium]|jgi:DegV family protein with EDD domain|nr:DegV family protein [Lachnospiraceae bacterium]MCI9250603.1 DegV family protein [Lachnospiraceae bacterium]MCI9382976.1 DegV family protein [Lachnospiraceae bacterium]MCI9479132.1 DegV family protein [Lachnospiraceae bacterium]MCI9623611.1 DegV family protein [Lachnospiraceae bacterium]